MLEEELKFDVPDSFVMPPLKDLAARIVAKKPKTLTATYFDTEDLRLARSGASLRYRVGDDLPWTVKLATDVPGVRHEISMDAPRGRPPADLKWLVAALTRGATLRHVALVQSERRCLYLVGEEGQTLAEVSDDRVASETVSFREIEVERKDGTSELLSTVERELTAAGARPGEYPSKLARVLGKRARKEPDLVPAGSLPSKPDGADVVAYAIRRGVERILTHDPLVRLGDPLPDGDTPVHQMRVGTRRLRSDLKTFKKLLDSEWTTNLRTELGWLAGLLGAARDSEVIRARLHRTAEADPLAPMDSGAIARMDEALAARHTEAIEALDAGMRTRRYVALVELLTEATREQPFTKRAKRPLVTPRTEDLDTIAESLTSDAPDEQWHAFRIRVKRARYAAEAVSRKSRLAQSLASAQDLLGEHQDAAVAAETWLSFAEDPALAVTAGRLYERERAAIRKVRSEFPLLWQAYQ